MLEANTAAQHRGECPKTHERAGLNSEHVLEDGDNFDQLLRSPCSICFDFRSFSEVPNSLPCS